MRASSWVVVGAAVITMSTGAASGSRGAEAPSAPADPAPSAQTAGVAVAVQRTDALLEKREQEIELLKARLASLDDSEAYLEASRLGVTQSVRSSGLTDKQQRRVATAIVREARRHGLDPLLLVALIETESSWNNYAVSGVGAMGLMQVMPDTATFWLVKGGRTLGRRTNLFDPELNIELGTSYLASLMIRFGGIEQALVAYNAGPSAARRILSNDASRRRFLAGYPKKVVARFRVLKGAQEKALVERERLGSASQKEG